MKKLTKVLAYTNPFAIPILAGMFVVAFTVAFFAGTYNNMKRILRD